MLKDIAGRAEQEVEIEAGASVGAVFDHCAERFPRLRDYEQSIVLARNQEFSSRSEELAAGDEVAFLPPVTTRKAAPSSIWITNATSRWR